MSDVKKYLDEEGLKVLWNQVNLNDYPNNSTLVAILDAIDETKANKDDIPLKVSQLENDSKFTSEEQVEALYKKLNSNTVLSFYCVEDVTLNVSGISTTYPANSNVEIKLLEGDVFEIIPTSNNSILSLSAFPGALGTYYPWLEGVKQFSNILFDMNAEDMYTKWNQGNQGAYQVQYAQYVNCIFWSDNPYISELSKRTNYTLYYSSQLPLCYSTIPENTFKAFYLAFGVNNDPNWGNKAYRDSFANATWATQAFSYYGARTIGIFGHDDPDFNIILPADCRGLMSAATAIENAGTFDAINTTNFGASSGSWRDAFGWCGSLRNLYIKNLKVNLNVSWSPLEYDSIYFIISTAANTNRITISVSPYTYNLLSQADFDLAESKNITIALITTNYIEDRRLSAINLTGDGTKVLSNNGTYVPLKTSQLENDSNFITEDTVEEHIAALVNSAPETLDTLGEIAEALQGGADIVDTLNNAIVAKADKAYVDEHLATIPSIEGLASENYVDEAVENKQNKNVIIYRDSTTKLATMMAPDIMERVRAGDNVYYTPSLTAGTLHSYLEGSDNMVYFYSNYVDNNKVMGTGVTIDDHGNITTETYQLAHLTDTSIHITEDERTEWNTITDKADKTYVDEQIAAIGKEDLKEKDLIVTYAAGSNNRLSTHSVSEIKAAFENGQSIVFVKQGENLNLLEVTDDFATFYIVYLNTNNKLQQKIVALSGYDVILEQGDIYDYATKDSLKNYCLKTEVDTKIANLVNSAPETLDTLGEIAAALQNDANIVEVLNQSVANKANTSDVLIKAEQTLTDEELTQVRSNLKFIGKDVSGQTFNIDGTDIVASNNAEIFGDYENNIAVGQWSIAEGSGTLAKGRASHVEGAYGKALADGTHVEGYGCTATGYWSHAEGEMTTVSSYASHAEGSYCTMPDGTKRYSTAAGYASHTEGGGCHTTGTAAHAEGIGTTAGGRCAHAEGIYTIASGKVQHVEGMANIEDTEDKYIHIAGNGVDPSNTSNAHTLDWQGNAWYAGDVYVGSTSGKDKDEGSKKLATEAYVDIRVPAWTEADEGAVLKIVNGTPTWVKIPNAEEASF